LIAIFFYQIFICASIVFSGFFGKRLPLIAAGLWALFTVPQVLVMPLMILQFVNIGFSLMLGSGLGSMTSAIYGLFSPKPHQQKVIETYPSKLKEKTKAFTRCDWCDVWVKDWKVEEGGKARLCESCYDIGRGSS
jgi:hypothetical protein